MIYIETLLNGDVSNEVKCEAANNIIGIYELPLSINHTLLAFKNICDWLNSPDQHTIKKRGHKDYVFLFDKILNFSKNMYIALISALCNNLHPDELYNFMIFKNKRLIDIGVNPDFCFSAILSYKKLLNHYEFDASSIQNIISYDKKLLQNYRASIYSGKLTKRAIKNE